MKVKELFEKVITPWNQDSMDVEKAINFLNANCKSGIQSIANGNILFRGFRKSPKGDFTFIDSTESARTSQDSNNLYQLMMDESSDLKGYPSRSKSLICSGDFANASEYTIYTSNMREAHVVIPFDGTLIVECSVPDIFDTSVHIKIFEGDLQELGTNIREFLKILGLNPNNGQQFTDVKRINTVLSAVPPEFLAAAWLHTVQTSELWLEDENGDALIINASKGSSSSFNAIVKTVNKMYGKYSAGQRYIIDFFRKADRNKYFTALSSEIMTRKNLELSTFTTGQPMKYKFDECWFSGKCVVISLEMFETIIAEMEKKKMKIHKSIYDMLDL